MARTVVIPDYVKPNYTVTVNGKKHTFPSGQAVEVPDGIAEIIENDIALDPQKDPAAKLDVGKALRGIISRTITEAIVPSGVTKIGNGAFIYCNPLQKVLLPESLTVIELNAFRNCIKLTEIVIPAAVTTIGEGAFSYCSKLTAATFLGTPTSINETAFSNTDLLTDIYVPWAEGAVADAPWGATNATIHYNPR